MAQLTIRTHEALVARVRAAALAHGASMNAYVTEVLEAATNPDLATSESERIRERLAAAGLLASPVAERSRHPHAHDVARARAAAAHGIPLSDLVSDGRG